MAVLAAAVAGALLAQESGSDGPGSRVWSARVVSYLGEPVVAAEVVVRDDRADRRVVERTFTDAEGWFRVRAVFWGPMSFAGRRARITKDGLAPLEVGEGEAVEVVARTHP